MKTILLLSLLLALPAGGQVINAASCSESAVQAAFNSVTNSTTTINIPACSGGSAGHWTSHVTLSIPSGNTNLTLQGSTTCTGSSNGTVAGTCTDNTVIIDDDSSDTDLLFGISTAGASSHLTIKGLTLQGGSGSTKNNGMWDIQGQTHNLRITQVHINMQTYSPSNNGATIRFLGWPTGVMDTFRIDLQDVGNGPQVWYDAYNGDVQGFGDNAWAAPTNFGGTDAMYFENGTIATQSTNKFGTGSDCSHGGKQVFRFNAMVGTSLQTHPTGGSGRGRGCRSTEAYKNTFSGNNSSGGSFANFNGMFISSGPLMMWGNSLLTGFTNFMTIHSMQVDNSTYPESPTPNGWGYCGTSSGLSGGGSAWNGNQPNSSVGYPCIDQPGRGQGDQLQNDFPNAKNTRTGNIAWPNQALEPVREWMNSWVAVPGAGGGYLANYEPSVLTQNQDYYLWCNASSASGCTSFTNGASGNGSGTLAARPANCTTGVAYWATDQGSWNNSGSGGQGALYTCTATNTWSSSPTYTPLQYPHPLIAPTLSDPTNLSGVAKMSGAASAH